MSSNHHATVETISRRGLLAGLGATAAALALAACGGEPAPLQATGCATRPDFEGPFYKPTTTAIADLTQHGSDGAPAFTNPVTTFRLDGTILGGATCNRLLSGAQVDIWHADPDGHYDVKESSPGAGDAVPDEANQVDFRTRLVTDDSGRFTLITYVPFGYYDRPQHIHLKITAADHEELITQLYFNGDPKWDNISADERSAIDPDRSLTLAATDEDGIDATATARLRLASV